MNERRIYFSYAVEDAEQVRPLRLLLEGLGMTVVASWPEAIAGATSFVACFSGRGDDTTRYNRIEIEAAIQQAPKMPPQWMVFVQLGPCAIPQLPGALRNAPVVTLPGGPPEPATQGSATFILKAKEMVGDHANIVNVKGDATGGNTNARMEITTEKFVTDGVMDITNFTGTSS